MAGYEQIARPNLQRRLERLYNNTYTGGSRGKPGHAPPQKKKNGPAMPPAAPATDSSEM